MKTQSCFSFKLECLLSDGDRNCFFSVNLAYERHNASIEVKEIVYIKGDIRKCSLTRSLYDWITLLKVKSDIYLF